MSERTEKILKEINEQYERDKATVQGMTTSEKRVLATMLVAAVLIAIIFTLVIF